MCQTSGWGVPDEKVFSKTGIRPGKWGGSAAAAEDFQAAWPFVEEEIYNGEVGDEGDFGELLAIDRAVPFLKVKLDARAMKKIGFQIRIRGVPSGEVPRGAHSPTEVHKSLGSASGHIQAGTGYHLYVDAERRKHISEDRLVQVRQALPRPMEAFLEEGSVLCEERRFGVIGRERCEVVRAPSRLGDFNRMNGLIEAGANGHGKVLPSVGILDLIAVLPAVLCVCGVIQKDEQVGRGDLMDVGQPG